MAKAAAKASRWRGRVAVTNDSEGGAPSARSNTNQAWARWVARSLDGFLYLALSYCVWMLIGTYWYLGEAFGLFPPGGLDWLLASGIRTRVAETAVFVLLILIFEPFFVGLGATTPGKWIMGIRVVRGDGRKLGYGQALARSSLVVMLGTAFFIPIVSGVAMLLQFGRVQGGQLAAWDEIVGVRVEHARRPAFLWFVLIVLTLGAGIALRWEEISARLNQAG